MLGVGEEDHRDKYAPFLSHPVEGAQGQRDLSMQGVGPGRLAEVAFVRFSAVSPSFLALSTLYCWGVVPAQPCWRGRLSGATINT